MESKYERKKSVWNHCVGLRSIPYLQTTDRLKSPNERDNNHTPKTAEAIIHPLLKNCEMTISN